jgi:hypothetical protein
VDATGRLRAQSRLVLGNRYRAELILALARAGQTGVCLGDLAQACGTVSSVYHAPVKALIEAGLVEKLPGVRGDHRRWYRRRGDLATWSTLGQMVERLSG